MGFIYRKPMSIEEVFRKFDTNNDGKISKREAENAKNLDIFTSFKVNKGMTLQSFESNNSDVYNKYEKSATLAYNKQEKRVKQWLESGQDAMYILGDTEKINLKEIESELEKQKEELELKLAIQKDAIDSGITLSSEELKELSPESLIQLVNAKKMLFEAKELLKNDINKSSLSW